MLRRLDRVGIPCLPHVLHCRIRPYKCILQCLWLRESALLVQMDNFARRLPFFVLVIPHITTFAAASIIQSRRRAFVAIRAAIPLVRPDIFTSTTVSLERIRSWKMDQRSGMSQGKHRLDRSNFSFPYGFPFKDLCRNWTQSDVSSMNIELHSSEEPLNVHISNSITILS